MFVGLKAPIERLKQYENKTISKLKYRLSSQRKRSKMLGLNGFADTSDGPRFKPQFRDEVKERILEIAREQTKIIKTEWGLSLSQYGYPV